MLMTFNRPSGVRMKAPTMKDVLDLDRQLEPQPEPEPLRIVAPPPPPTPKRLASCMDLLLRYKGKRRQILNVRLYLKI